MQDTEVYIDRCCASHVAAGIPLDKVLPRVSLLSIDYKCRHEGMK